MPCSCFAYDCVCGAIRQGDAEWDFGNGKGGERGGLGISTKVEAKEKRGGGRG